MYRIKEIYNTIQGEGFHAGKAAVFLRFSGCNLWNGREDGRRDAICKFCDTDFLGTDGDGGGKYETARELAKAVSRAWESIGVRCGRFVVCTGGEPMLQIDKELVAELKSDGFFVAIETNGTICKELGEDWICVSPKHGAACNLKSGNELKVAYPQVGMDMAEMSEWAFENFYVQPISGDSIRDNSRRAVEFCMNNPKWRLSIQLQNVIGIR